MWLRNEKGGQYNFRILQECECNFFYACGKLKIIKKEERKEMKVGKNKNAIPVYAGLIL